jgi:hypothetical protein
VNNDKHNHCTYARRESAKQEAGRPRKKIRAKKIREGSEGRTQFQLDSTPPSLLPKKNNTTLLPT